MSSLLRCTLFNPFVIALPFVPKLFQNALPISPNQWPFYSAGLKVLQPFAIVVTVARLLGAINQWLSKKATNNFVEDPTWDWPNELAVVTGGSSGIGAEIVRGLVMHKVKTIILDINPPASKPVNLTSSSEACDAATIIKSTHGNPTILINNAGTGTAQTILSESESERRRVFEVNSLCHFTLVREFLPAMIERNHGHVMTVASTGSFYSQSQNVSYASSKASAMAFHEGLGQELRSRYNARRVRTSIVYPDFVRTPLVEALTSKVSQFPLKIAEPSEIADEAVAAILSTYGHSIVLPRSMEYLALLRGLPLWIQRIVQAYDPDPLALVNQ
ncbi:NAD(P)-binding protein [Lindgomyces ingoldianus]|uniref:NAD(P)-binding protein n=1 Tax=Lindgomyces ingoldianus TaxID=673940 RepID=A0ACB6QC34_9PLEO|nr:NAD(P)-binding protein [Lindgomyces ingoldianus]KAF2464415.1 NAD(P)-binding protein [Lindgomyces ingoldianus]